MTVERVLPFLNDTILPCVMAGKSVMAPALAAPCGCCHLGQLLPRWLSAGRSVSVCIAPDSLGSDRLFGRDGVEARKRTSNNKIPDQRRTVPVSHAPVDRLSDSVELGLARLIFQHHFANRCPLRAGARARSRLRPRRHQLTPILRRVGADPRSRASRAPMPPAERGRAEGGASARGRQSAR